MILVAGKSHTMLGSADSSSNLGVIPCAITWLFRGINEQKLKTGARFSVRVSAVEVAGPSQHLKDLLSGHANGKFGVFMCARTHECEREREREQCFTVIYNPMKTTSD